MNKGILTVPFMEKLKLEKCIVWNTMTWKAAKPLKPFRAELSNFTPWLCSIIFTFTAIIYFLCQIALSETPVLFSIPDWCFNCFIMVCACIRNCEHHYLNECRELHYYFTKKYKPRFSSSSMMDHQILLQLLVKLLLVSQFTNITY